MIIFVIGFFVMLNGIKIVNHLALIGTQPKDKRVGWSLQLLGVTLMYYGWMQHQLELTQKLWLLIQ